jgi:hypothetical protein
LAPGHILLFANRDGAVHESVYQQGQWSAWTRIPSPPVEIDSAPAATLRGNRVDLFVRGADTAFWHTTRQPTWSSWESLGGEFFGKPAAAAASPQDIYVAGQGKNTEVFYNAWGPTTCPSRPGAWCGWLGLGGLMASGSSPTITSWGGTRFDAFVTGIDGFLWHVYHYDDFDVGWLPYGGLLASSPSVVSRTTRQYEVFGVGEELRAGYPGSATSRELWYRQWNEP